MATSYHGYLGQRQVQSTQQLHLLASLMGELSTVPALPSAYSTRPRTALLRRGDKNRFQWGPKCRDKFELWLKYNGEAWEA